MCSQTPFQGIKKGVGDSTHIERRCYDIKEEQSWHEKNQETEDVLKELTRLGDGNP